jgi:hypothetical protein
MRASGLGVAILDNATMLGWFSNSTIALDPGCQVVLVQNSEEQLSRFAELLGRSGRLCSDSAVSKSGGAQ